MAGFTASSPRFSAPTSQLYSIVLPGEAFDGVTADGPNIAVTDMTRFDVLYDTVAGKITVSKPVK